MNEEINILLIGSTGSGKSALVNLLVNKNRNFEEVFKESAGMTSETKEHQTTVFKEEGVTYRIIDTVSLDDVPEQDISYKLAELAREIKDGINQILFVTNGRFTEKEVGIFGILGAGLFDKEIFNFTTIVRTKFPMFENLNAREQDYQNLTSEGEVGSKLVGSVRKVIHIDNPSLKGSNPKLTSVNKEIKESSRATLMKHLKNFKTVYRPTALQTLNRKIDDLEEYKNDKDKVSSVASDIFQESFKIVKESTEIGANIGGKFLPGLGQVAGGLVGLGASFGGSLIYTGVRLTEELLKGGVGLLASDNKKDKPNQQSNNLQSENSQLKNQLEISQAKTAQNELTIQNKQSEINRLKQTNTNLEGIISSLREQVNAIQKEKENLTRDLKSSRTAKQTSEAELNSTIANLRQQIKVLQETISSVPETSAVIQQPPQRGGNI